MKAWISFAAVCQRFFLRSVISISALTVPKQYCMNASSSNSPARLVFYCTSARRNSGAITFVLDKLHRLKQVVVRDC